MSENTASAKAMEKEKPETTKNADRVGKKAKSTLEASLNMEELRELAELVNEHGFTDFEFENENIRVRLSKTPAVPLNQQYQPVTTTAAAPTVTSGTVTESTSPATSVTTEEELFKIMSPIVGTFYRSAGPDKEPYVKEGSKVSDSTIVCIVEAMKLMNEIEAEISGEIVQIYVENGQPVEYGQPLFGVRK